MSDILFANIFSHSVGSLFVLLIVSFTVQKLLVWCSPICLFLLLFPLPEETYPKKILLRPMSKRVLPVFSSRSFMVLGLTFKSLIYLEFIFVYEVRKRSCFIFCTWISSLPNTICWRDYTFPVVYFWHPCQRSVDFICMSSFLGSLFCPIGLYGCLYTSNIMFWLL